MRSTTVQQLVNFFSASLGGSGEIDLFYGWVESAMTVIREQPWAWNWTKKDLLTYAPVQETGKTFSWTEGNNYIVCSAPLAILNYTHTGRKVKLGNEFYQCVDVGLSNTSRIYVDRLIQGSASGQTPNFVRDEIAVNTTKIRTVEIDSGKIPRYGEEYKSVNFNWRYLFQMDTGTPIAYMDSDSTRLPAPAFPPKVSGVNGVAWETAGKFVYYYFTRRDIESGLESEPGPVLKYTAAAGQPTIIYDNPAGNFSENTSYQLVLYRSEASPTREKFPSYEVYTRPPSATNILDTNTGTLYGKLRYWDGPRCVIRLLFPPDSTVRTVHIDHLDNWSYRISERDTILLGNDSQIEELLRIYLAGMLGLSSRSPQEYRAGLAAFRGQMNYLVTRSRDSGADDRGPANYNKDVPGWEYGDWVDGLGWKT